MLERVRASAVDEIVVVLGAHEVSSSERVVRCPDWELGPGTSLRCGLRALGPDVEAAVVVLARSAWADVPDDGARSLGAVLVPCDDLGFPGDVDVGDDLPQWLKSRRSEI